MYIVLLYLRTELTCRLHPLLPEHPCNYGSHDQQESNHPDRNQNFLPETRGVDCNHSFQMLQFL